MFGVLFMVTYGCLARTVIERLAVGNEGVYSYLPLLARCKEVAPNDPSALLRKQSTVACRSLCQPNNFEPPHWSVQRVPPYSCFRCCNDAFLYHAVHFFLKFCESAETLTSSAFVLLSSLDIHMHGLTPFGLASAPEGKSLTNHVRLFVSSTHERRRPCH